MWQFIISGYVPGTDFQITFEMFELFILFLLGGAVLYSLLRQFAYFYIATLKIQSGAKKQTT